MSDLGASYGPGSRPSDGAASASPPSVSIPNALTWRLHFKDGSEALSVAYDINADYFSNQVAVRQYDSDDREIYLEPAEARWLSLRLLDAAQAIEARRAETGTGSVHESAFGTADAPNTSRSSDTGGE